MKEHTASSAEDRRRFLDEMLVWREMAVHFVYYHPDNYDGAFGRTNIRTSCVVLTYLNPHTRIYT